MLVHRRRKLQLSVHWIEDRFTI
ncbi:hypothetical protein KSF78_0001189 [Schistosoma japonicum]|nr:hypothetical protein KSF78_0001189 [Schistosoma japonicum]KAH8852661.1 hypothetical protein KSF78_0001189 [Schistosoma japonicum]KAH8852662.1 hypothetical protein KSF78_0001189 [Schistosoma japonicum]